MSYENAKYISIDKKNNKITITSYCNNLHPVYIEKYEAYTKKSTIKEKVICLLKDILDGNFHINQSTNKRLIKVIGQEFHGKYIYNDFCCSDIWQKCYNLNNIAWGFGCAYKDREKPEEVKNQKEAEKELYNILDKLAGVVLC